MSAGEPTPVIPWMQIKLLTAYRAKTSTNRKQDKKGGKPTILETKKGFRKR